MTDLSEPTKYIFISYSTSDQEKADAFRRLLEAENIPTWMAPYDIAPGKKYAAVIENAIRNCAGFALLLSVAAQESEWVDSEVERARTHKKEIVPIALDDVVLNDSFSFYLSNRQIVAVHDIDKSAPEVQQLLVRIRMLVPKIIDYAPKAQLERESATTNKQDFLNRKRVHDYLKGGDNVIREVQLRDCCGKLVKDPLTGEFERIDYVVIKDGQVAKLVVVTTDALRLKEKRKIEERIRKNGDIYIRDSNDILIKIPADVNICFVNMNEEMNEIESDDMDAFSI